MDPKDHILHRPDTYVGSTRSRPLEEYVSNPENNFQMLVKHAGQSGIPVDVFEPKGQPGILVIGAKVVMKNSKIARYLGFSAEEKERFEKKVNDYCNSIQVINKIITEDGKQKVGVYVVMEDKENINQQTMLEAIETVSEKYDQTSRFLLKTF